MKTILAPDPNPVKPQYAPPPGAHDALNSSQGAWRGVCMTGSDVTDKELETLHAAGVRGARFNFVAHLGGAAICDGLQSKMRV